MPQVQHPKSGKFISPLTDKDKRMMEDLVAQGTKLDAFVDNVRQLFDVGIPAATGWYYKAKNRKWS